MCGTVLTEHTDTALDAELTRAGYDLGKVIPSNGNIAIIILAILGLSALSGATYGPAAALLSELFPPRIRYSSMSIPYHIGTGYFGGFLPLVSQYVVARTGRSEEHTSELQSLMRISYAVFCLKKKNNTTTNISYNSTK